MTTRTLPPAEWARLRGTELEHVWPGLPTDEAQIVVVEDEGQIVGCWAAYRAVHVEGVWIHPDHRRSRVALRLWRGMRRVVAEMFGAGGAWTGSQSPEIDALLAGRATEVDGRHFLIRFGAT